MHLLFATRGDIYSVERLTDYLKTMPCYIPVKNEKGEVVKVDCESMLLQPIQLWSFVFPKEYQDHVLTALKCDEDSVNRYVKDDIKIKAGIKALQKIFSCEPIPKFNIIPSEKDSLCLLKP